jgi:hypothetical protein
MARLVTERRAEASPAAPSPAPAPPSTPVAAELSASSLLWRAFLSWLRALIGKKENPR